MGGKEFRPPAQKWGKFMCGFCAIGCRYCYSCKVSGGDWELWLSAYWGDRKIAVTSLMRTSNEMSSLRQHKSIILAHGGAPIDNIDTHSLCSGGAVALALSGYYDTQIQKKGRWKGSSFKEYIHKDLAC